MNINITGEYFFIIKTDNDEIRTKTYHNLIVDKGVQFFLKRIYDNELSISEISFGKGTTEPTSYDDSLEQETNTSNELKFKTQENKCIITVETTGEYINETTEIGVKYIDENGDTHLISRDVHEILEVPTTAIVTTNYTYNINVNGE